MLEQPFCEHPIKYIIWEIEIKNYSSPPWPQAQTDKLIPELDFNLGRVGELMFNFQAG